MKTVTKLYLGSAIVFIGMNSATAAIAAPEMDSSIAALGLGLATAVAALISERRRK
ncbi:hypothetical protein [Methylotuvimicrobium sp. KM1]|jgi:hypothetical protein|uniref:hypothetical protein n=1 Tax=unclassified Methylotuvimicrobium TaxID=2822412 RepID=UPI00384C2845